MNNIAASEVEMAEFKKRLAAYKKIIDADIASYAKEIQASTLKQFGKNARLELDAFLSILGRGGKRIRGSLVILGYEMSGGIDRKMILMAARAIEIMHAYILIVDDIQDRSLTRRGGPSAHTLFAQYHKKHRMNGDPEHFGMAVALNSGLSGSHAANMLLANLNVDPELRSKVISIVNRTMVVTAHGQTNDVMNEVAKRVSRADVERVMEWKTAYYTVLNPLHVGMVLAGADCQATDAITPYAMHVGKAFQLSDDIMGVFGEEQASGKSPLDDIKEGKRTLLTLFALEKAAAKDKEYLLKMLGNRRLTAGQLEKCQAILRESGALKNAQNAMQKHVTSALKSLDQVQGHWSPDGVAFLRGLAHYLEYRES